MLIRINRSRYRLMKLVVLVLASAWLLPTTVDTGSSAGRVAIRSRVAGPAAIGTAHHRRHQVYQGTLPRRFGER